MQLNRGVYVRHPGTREQTWTSITITAVGGAGGTGGSDSHVGYTGYPGRIVSGSIEVELNSSLDIYIGKGGIAGVSGSNAAGGEGGISTIGMPGGRGGRSGPSGWSGSGGGGGAATVVKRNGQYWIVAAGGAGGGGGGQYSNGNPSQGFSPNSSTAGGEGTSHPGDGGGGGGGGGGYALGGVGGNIGEGDVGAYSGSWGDSLYPYGFYDNADGSNPPSSNGFVTITYASATGSPYFSGGTISYGTAQNGQTSVTHTFNSDGKFIGQGPTNRQSVAWQQLLVPHVHDAGTWKQIRAIHTKNGGQWKKVWPSNGKAEYTVPGVYDFTVPPGIYSLNIVVAGAGGGGGGGVGSVAGNGGGAGETATRTVSVVPGQVLSVFVGAGGHGGDGNNEQYGSASTGADGRGSTVTGGSVSISVTGGTGGAGGVATAPPAGGGGGCCVVSTAFAETGIWNRRQRDELIVWCESKLHNKTLGECFRRGYQVLGSKVIVPALKSRLGRAYYKWAFNNGTNLVRGKKFSWLSVPNTAVWIAGFMLVGAVVSTEYANKSWKLLYKDQK